MTNIVHNDIAIHVRLFGYSFKKIKLKKAPMKGAKLSIISVLATLVFQIDTINVTFVNETIMALNTPAKPMA